MRPDRPPRYAGGVGSGTSCSTCSSSGPRATPHSDPTTTAEPTACNAVTASPKTWYGMPAYARDGHVVCFFQGAQRFKARYSTLGFNDAANLDDGNMWPTAFALTKLTTAEETKIRKLLERASR